MANTIHSGINMGRMDNLEKKLTARRQPSCFDDLAASFPAISSLLTGLCSPDLIGILLDSLAGVQCAWENLSLRQRRQRFAGVSPQVLRPALARWSLPESPRLGLPRLCRHSA